MLYICGCTLAADSTKAYVVWAASSSFGEAQNSPEAVDGIRWRLLGLTRF